VPTVLLHEVPEMLTVLVYLSCPKAYHRHIGCKYVISKPKNISIYSIVYSNYSYTENILIGIRSRADFCGCGLRLCSVLVETNNVGLDSVLLS
jgi:hypothetical protein